MSYGWEGELVRLVPIDIDRHLENAIQWINDPEVTRYLKAGDFPMTRLAEREWMERASKSDTTITMAVELLDGKHIGFSGFHQISWRDRTALTGTMLGDKGAWGKGFGTDAAKTRSRYAFEVLGLRVLYSSVFDGNHGSLKMLKKAGYVKCGRWPKRRWKRGEFLDEILVYLDRDMWLRAKE